MSEAGPPPSADEPAATRLAASRLAAARARATSRLAALTRDFDAIVRSAAESPPDDEHDPEGATLGFERAQVAALVARTRADLADLDAAEERLASGTYGVCDVCGTPIGDERLEARPSARRCARCATAGR